MSLFGLGAVVTTMGIRRMIEEDPAFGERVMDCLVRHSMGDWGDLCADDAELNDSAVKAERDGRPTDRIRSVYRKDGEEDVWVITEYDRSATTILLPEEY